MQAVLISAAVAGLLLALYGGLAYVAGEFVSLVTIVLMGTPIFLYWAFEWAVPPLLALCAGIVGRYFPSTALLTGVPLVVLATVVSPVVSSGNDNLPVPVPWLAVFDKQYKVIEPVIVERATLWLGVFAVAFLLAIASRLIWRPKPSAEEVARQRMQARLEELKHMTPEREKPASDRRPWN